MKNLPELKQVFLKTFPSFKSFNSSGQEYLDSEDTYKRRTSSYLHQLFDDWISSDSDSLSTEEFIRRLKSLFADKLPGLSEKQNFINWRDQDKLYKDILDTEGNTREFMSLLHTLLSPNSVGGAFEEPLQNLLAWLTKNGCPASMSKAIPTFFLCFWNPQRHLFIKPSIFDSFLNSIGEKNLGSGKYLTVDEYHRILNIMHALRTELNEWEPRDMIDLQSFYFVTQYELNSDDDRDDIDGEGLKTIRSWSKPSNIEGLIGRKKVDWSIFLYGTHIPIGFIEDFEKANNDFHLDIGQSRELKLLIGSESYTANLNNFKSQSKIKDTLQIRYDGNKILIQTLRNVLKRSFEYLQKLRSTKNKDKSHIEIPDDYSEYIDFYQTDVPFQYRLEIIPSEVQADEVMNDLSEPFKRIFKNRQLANWAFDFLKDACDRLKITGPNDLRISVTLRNNKRVLRLNFGNWAVLQFYSPECSQYSIGIPLIEDQIQIEGQYRAWGAFANSSPSISVYEMPIELGKPLENNIRQVYENTLSLIAERFSKWKSSGYLHAHRKDIAEAIFDIGKREKLFNDGITDFNDQTAQNIWWVNQGATLNEEKEAGILWAPIKSSDGKSLYQWETMTEVEQGDTILHYANGALRYVSEVIEPAIETKRLTALKNQTKDDDGRMVRTEYCKLEPAIALGKFSTDVSKLNIHQGPIDANGNVKPGYLFRFNIDALQIVKKSQPETEWPEFVPFFENAFTNYWVFQGNPNVFDVVRALRDRNVSTWSVAAHKKEIKKGDKIILWVTGKNAGCYALGTVTSDVYNDYDDKTQMQYAFTYENTKTDRCRVTFDSVLADKPIIDETIKNNPILKTLKVGLQGTNFSATKEQFDELLKIAASHTAIIDPPPMNPIYTFEDLSQNTGFETKELERWIKALKRKKQVIIYGPPGTGKTYVAEQISRYLISGTDGFSEIVQFHPAYAYEDFMQGIRPKAGENGHLDFAMVEGRFLQFSYKARSRNGVCVLIIDEINRANLARVFGELMYLLEYRDRPIPLASGGTFQIPDNVRIIGTMNTADRSIALVDHALRRRFAFLALYPNYDILRRYHQQSAFNVETLVNLLQKLNRQIADRHYEVGISFFLRNDLADQIEDIWRLEIEPYLEEYFFDQPDKVETFRWDKVSNEIEL